MRVYNITDHRVLVEATPGKLTRLEGGKSLDLPAEHALRVLSANPFLSGHKDGDGTERVAWEKPEEDRRRGDAGPVVEPVEPLAEDGTPVVTTPGGDGAPGNPDGTTYDPASIDYAAIAAELKGDALDQALAGFNLPRTGSAEDKRARYAEYIRELNNPAPEDTGTPAPVEDVPPAAADPEDGGPATNDNA